MGLKFCVSFVIKGGWRVGNPKFALVTNKKLECKH